MHQRLLHFMFYIVEDVNGYHSHATNATTTKSRVCGGYTLLLKVVETPPLPPKAPDDANLRRSFVGVLRGWVGWAEFL